MKNCLVTGGTGFIGSHLIKSLINNDIKVYALIRPNSSLGINRLDGIAGIEYIESSSKRLILNKSLPQFDVCFNLAAYGVNYEQQNLNEMIEGNVKFLMDIIDFAVINNTKLLIHTGSCFEYGINEGKEISEEAKLDPQSLYGASKTAGYIIGNTYAKIKNVKMITVRPFGVYGPGEGNHKLIPQMIASIINGTKLDMTLGEQIRDYLYIDDLIDAYIKLATSKSIHYYESYNVCSSEAIKLKDLGKILADICNFNEKIFNYGAIPYRINEVMYFVGKNAKIENEVSWRPKISLRTGLKLTVDWYKNKL
ncbi:NAD-dependent epimerase/dehydratase family protein [Clostridium saccharoperbutylacetonicum]|jgi:nucleoside-diphosphate-sugar epimerase